MGDKWSSGKLAGELAQVVGVARHDLLAVARRPATCLDRDCDRSGREVGRPSLHRLDLDRLLDLALGHDLAELFVQPLDHGPQLELRRHLAQPAAVGLGAGLRADIYRDLDVLLQGG